MRSPQTPSPAPPGSAGAPPKADEITLEAYKQASEDFRQMNQIFWQAPAIIITITGGLGVAVVALDASPFAQKLVLGFAALCNVFWIAILIRIRTGVMEDLLGRTKAFVLICFCLLLGTTALGCLLAAWKVDEIVKSKDKDRKDIKNPINYEVLVVQSYAAPEQSENSEQVVSGK